MNHAVTLYELQTGFYEKPTTTKYKKRETQP